MVWNPEVQIHSSRPDPSHPAAPDGTYWAPWCALVDAGASQSSGPHGASARVAISADQSDVCVAVT
jgi:hypothetical protein